MDRSSYFSSLSSKQKLERDRGLEIVKEILSGSKNEDITKLVGDILELLASTNCWEGTHGALCASAVMIEAGVCSDDFYREVEKAVPAMLEHIEPRLRLAAGLWQGGSGLLVSGLGYTQHVLRRSYG